MKTLERRLQAVENAQECLLQAIDWLEEALEDTPLEGKFDYPLINSLRARTGVEENIPPITTIPDIYKALEKELK